MRRLARLADAHPNSVLRVRETGNARFGLGMRV